MLVEIKPILVESWPCWRIPRKCCSMFVEFGPNLIGRNRLESDQVGRCWSELSQIMACSPRIQPNPTGVGPKSANPDLCWPNSGDVDRIWPEVGKHRPAFQDALPSFRSDDRATWRRGPLSRGLLALFLMPTCRGNDPVWGRRAPWDR